MMWKIIVGFLVGMIFMAVVFRLTVDNFRPQCPEAVTINDSFPVTWVIVDTPMDTLNAPPPHVSPQFDSLCNAPFYLDPQTGYFHRPDGVYEAVPDSIQSDNMFWMDSMGYPIRPVMIPTGTLVWRKVEDK